MYLTADIISMSGVQVITTAPDIDRTRRRNMIQYSSMMGLRLICIFVCFFVPLMWVWVPALVAVLVPMVATFTATQQSARQGAVSLGRFDKELTR